MRIVLAAVPYSDTSGGAMAIHRLCDVLLTHGVDCAMLPMDPRKFRTCDRYLSAVTGTITGDDLLIYPERVEGNPYGAKHVARWLLYHTDHVKRRYGPRDVIVPYSAMFGKPPFLTVLDSRLDLFQDRGLPRGGTCWTMRKGTKQGWHPDHSVPGTEVPRGTSPGELADIFNRHKRFVSFDNATFLSEQAALCGCDSIVLAFRPMPTRLGVAKDYSNIREARRGRRLLRDSLIAKEAAQGLAAVSTIQWIKDQL